MLVHCRARRGHGTPQSYTQMVRSGGSPSPGGVAGMGSEGTDPWGLHSLQTAPGLICGSHTWGFTGSPPELDFSPRLGVPLWALCTLHPQELPGSPWASLNCCGCFLCTCQVCKIPNRTHAQPAPRSSPSLSSTVHIPVILPVTRLNLHRPHSPSSPHTSKKGSGSAISHHLQA